MTDKWLTAKSDKLVSHLPVVTHHFVAYCIVCDLLFFIYFFIRNIMEKKMYYCGTCNLDNRYPESLVNGVVHSVPETSQ